MGENYKNYEERFAGVKVYGLQLLNDNARILIDPQSNEPISYTELERVLLTRSCAVELPRTMGNPTEIYFITGLRYTTDYSDKKIIAARFGGGTSITAVSLTQDGVIPNMVRPG